MNKKKDYIRRVFTDLKGLKYEGIWFSGRDWAGKYKEWDIKGNLIIHRFYKNGELDGEYKQWDDSGRLYIHKYYENGKAIKDYLV